MRIGLTTTSCLQRTPLDNLKKNDKFAVWRGSEVKPSLISVVMARPNTDGSGSFLSPLEKSHTCRFGIILGDFLFFILKTVCCVHSLESLRIAPTQPTR